ncbi:helix-turn-helix domain-containing protein [Actinomadura namibiensis]|uniref:helix-turn-helix domain-containing protein n=1 Tax=Actinomadura kijaniata TaxID=46161 RepID=UPI0036160AEA
MAQQYYSVEQVAELLDLHVRTVRGYVRDGKLRATRIGKQYRIAREDLEEFTGAPRRPRRRRRRTPRRPRSCGSTGSAGTPPTGSPTPSRPC